MLLRPSGVLGWLVWLGLGAALALTGYCADPFLVFTEVPEIYVSDWEPNQSFVKTQYLNDVRGHPDRPTAFVFGDSSAGAFHTEMLEEVFGKELRFYNYSVSGESVEGVRAKLDYLRRAGYRLDVVLVVGLGFWTTPSYLRREHYLVSRETKARFYAYYATFPFQGFEEAVLRTLRRWTAPARSPDHEYRFRTGDVYYRAEDVAIEADADAYYGRLHPGMVRESRRQGIVPTRWSLSAQQRRDVRELGAALRDAGVSRSYLLLHGGWAAQVPDLQTAGFLCEEFSHVFVVAGTSRQSRDYLNYYDPTHYRPALARWMLDRLVQESSSPDPGDGIHECSAVPAR